MDFTGEMKNKRNQIGDKTSDFFFLFHTLNRGYHCCINKISNEIGLSKGQPPVLMFLDKETCRTQREIADFLNIKPASMTDVLQRMEKNGLVERKRGEKDLRTMHVKITEKGREKSEEFLLKERSLDALFFKDFDQEEKEIFLRMFTRMAENLMNELDCLGVEE